MYCNNSKILWRQFRLVSHNINLEQYREDQHGPCARMTRLIEKITKYFFFPIFLIHQSPRDPYGYLRNKFWCQATTYNPLNIHYTHRCCSSSVFGVVFEFELGEYFLFFKILDVNVILYLRQLRTCMLCMVQLSKNYGFGK